MNEKTNSAEVVAANVDIAMTKRTKIWKIGEYCAGGVIRAKSCGEFVKIEIRDLFTDELLNHKAFGRIHERQIMEFLTDSTTPYYADKVLSWIKEKVWGNK